MLLVQQILLVRQEQTSPPRKYTLGTLDRVTFWLATTLHQGNHDRRHKFWKIYTPDHMHELHINEKFLSGWFVRAHVIRYFIISLYCDCMFHLCCQLALFIRLYRSLTTRNPWSSNFLVSNNPPSRKSWQETQVLKNIYSRSYA
jgi:hypothetical protein